MGLRDLGTTMAPQNAFLTITGCETLPLRMERHCENAQKVAEFLEGHPKVAWVSCKPPPHPIPPLRFGHGRSLLPPPNSFVLF